MKKNCLLIFPIIFLSLSSLPMRAQKYEWPDIPAPVADKKSHIRDVHGDKVEDNYFWMIDFFKKGPDSSRVVSYLEAENAYLNEMMKGTQPLQEKLFTEMKSRIKEKDESVPVFKNGYYYYSRSEEDRQYYKFCRKKGSLSAAEEVLLDVDQLAEGHAYYAVGGLEVSPDNTLLAFAIDTVSRRQYTIHIKNLKTGEWLPDQIPSTNGNLVWANDNKTIFYTANDPETLLSTEIKRHILCTQIEKDAIVYKEQDNTNYIGVAKSSLWYKHPIRGWDIYPEVDGETRSHRCPAIITSA